MTKIPFKKPPLELEEFIPLLKKRGLIIADEAELVHDLKFIGYYRLSGYMFPFQVVEKDVNTHVFRKETSYKTIKEHYVFDRKLRLHVLDAIERVEIALRVAIVSRMSNLENDPFWYLKDKYFEDKTKHQSFLNILSEDIENSSELFLHHYNSKYKEDQPPAWMAFELLSFGTMSKIYNNLTEINQKVIAGTFKMQPKAFKSWMHSLSFVRNVCAHHQRLWNRNFPFSPSLSGLEKHFYISNGKQQDINKFYVRAAIMQMLLKIISPGSMWGENLKGIIKDHADVSIADMGFPFDWETRTFWNK